MERFRKAWASCKSDDEKKQLVERCTAEVADKAKVCLKRHLPRSHSHQPLYLQSFNAIKTLGNAETRKEAQRLQELTQRHVAEYVTQCMIMAGVMLLTLGVVSCSGSKRKLVARN